MLRSLITAVIMLAATVPAFAQSVSLTPEQQQTITQINEHNSAIKSMAGRFLQVDTQGGRTEGTFFLERPNKIAFRYAPPSREEIVSTGKGFYILNRQEQTAYAYPQDSIPLREFLTDKIDLFKTNITGVSESKGYFTVSLSDNTPAGTVEVALVFDTETDDLAQWVLTEPSGDKLTFSLYDVVKNEDIPNSLFSIPATYTNPNKP